MMWAYSCLLITMSRNMITFLRETFLHKFIPFDSFHAMHKFVAAIALMFTGETVFLSYWSLNDPSHDWNFNKRRYFVQLIHIFFKFLLPNLILLINSKMTLWITYFLPVEHNILFFLFVFWLLKISTKCITVPLCSLSQLCIVLAMALIYIIYQHGHLQI